MNQVELDTRIYILKWLLRGMSFNIANADPVTQMVLEDFEERGLCAATNAIPRFKAGALLIPANMPEMWDLARAELTKLRTPKAA